MAPSRKRGCLDESYEQAIKLTPSAAGGPLTISASENAMHKSIILVTKTNAKHGMGFLGRQCTRDPEPLELDSNVLGAILAHVSIEDVINFGRTDQSNRKTVKSLELVRVANDIEALTPKWS